MATVEELITHRVKLRFYDQKVTIQSDADSYVNIFSQLYGRFLVAESNLQTSGEITKFTILTKPNNPWGKPVLIIDGEVLPTDTAQLLEGFVYEHILNEIVASVRTHFLIHAGAVVADDQGIILVGDSGHGKTTLVVELVKRGFAFLSDELAAIGRREGKVHPFPRKLRIRPATLDLAEFPESVHHGPLWLGKLLLDMEDIVPNSLGTAAAIGHVIVLQDSTQIDGAMERMPERELKILVNRTEPGLVSELARVEGVTKVFEQQDRGYPMIRLRATRRTEVLDQIELICQERRILILDVIKRIEGSATFASDARLEPIPTSRAVIELIRRFQGGHKSSLLKVDFAGSSTRLYMELAAILGQARCHQLIVGPLDQMADLVCGLRGTR